MSENNANNKRTTTRVSYEVNVDFESEDRFFTGLVRNISDGGLFVAVGAPPPVGTRLTIKFSVPGMETAVTIETEVRWIRPPSGRADLPGGMGLQFLNLPGTVETKINEFIKKHETLFYDD